MVLCWSILEIKALLQLQFECILYHSINVKHCHILVLGPLELKHCKLHHDFFANFLHDDEYLYKCLYLKHRYTYCKLSKADETWIGEICRVSVYSTYQHIHPKGSYHRSKHLPYSSTTSGVTTTIHILLNNTITQDGD